MTRADVTRRLHEIAEEVARCERCPLYRDATQVVFGEGPANAAIMLVGEQPGDKEDIAGKPFVGPAGHVLDQALAEAGLDRAACYVTNAIKHFKYEQRGKLWLHKQPTRGEIQACRWWLDRELDIVRPQLVVALGVTAASPLKGKPVVLSRVRRQILDIDPWRVLATKHPSAFLRLRDASEREQAFRELVDDLRFALESLNPA
jgi:uracil-DNA glycosylase